MIGVCHFVRRVAWVGGLALLSCADFSNPTLAPDTDLVPKVLGLALGGGKATTNLTVALDIQTQEGDTVTHMYVSQDGTFEDGMWTPFEASSSLTFAMPSVLPSSLEVWVKLRDQDGHESLVATASTAYYPPTNLLLAHHPLDDDPGAVVAEDASGRGHLGQYVGNPTPLFSDCGGSPSVRRFNGWQEHLMIPQDPVLALGKDGLDFSVSFWIRLEAGPTERWRTLLAQFDGQENTFSVLLRPDDNRILVAGLGGDGAHVFRAFSGRELELARWQHVAIVKNGQQLFLYFDAVQVQGVVLSGSFESRGALFFGSREPPHGTASSLSDLRIHHGALTPPELATFVAQHPEVNPKRSPVVHFTFEGESPGQVDDESGHGHHGTISGDAGSVEDGFRENGYRFGGQGSVILETFDGFEGQTHVSVGAWVQVSSTASATLVSQRGPKSDTMFLGVESGGQSQAVLGFERQDDSLARARSDVSLALDEWQHLVGTYDGHQARLYLNGDLVGQSQQAALSPTAVGTSEVFVGRSGSSGGDPFIGLVDDLRVYPCTLSAKEVELWFQETE